MLFNVHIHTRANYLANTLATGSDTWLFIYFKILYGSTIYYLRQRFFLAPLGLTFCQFNFDTLNIFYLSYSYLTQKHIRVKSLLLTSFNVFICIL